MLNVQGGQAQHAGILPVAEQDAASSEGRTAILLQDVPQRADQAPVAQDSMGVPPSLLPERDPEVCVLRRDELRVSGSGSCQRRRGKASKVGAVNERPGVHITQAGISSGDSSALPQLQHGNGVLRGVPASTLTHYIIVRNDLPRGIQSANIVHAAGESSPGNLPEGTHAVVLVTPDESSLKAVAMRLELAQVPHRRILESDPPYIDQLMAIGLQPGQKEVLKRFVSSLPLLR